MSQFRYYRVISKAPLGFSVPDNQPSMTAHYNAIKMLLAACVAPVVASRLLRGLRGPLGSVQ